MNKQPPLLPVIIGTGFGAGFCPLAPGTAGAVLATAIWGLLSCLLKGNPLMFVTVGLIMLFTLLGTWATSKLEPYWGEDPNRVVVDEMVGVWVPLLPIVEGSMKWWLVALALVLFRLFDILKPLGIRSLDRRHGAFWVMADDLLAGIYALLIIETIILANTSSYGL